MDDIQFLASVVRDIGIWVVFAWLYVSEKKAHEITRDKYFSDLRDIAGLQKHLQNSGIKNSNTTIRE